MQKSKYGNFFSKIINEEILAPRLQAIIAGGGISKSVLVENKVHDSVGDNYFHPSIHCTPGARQLYFNMHPVYRENVIRRKKTYTDVITPYMGTNVHAVIQQTLIDNGVVPPEDIEVALVDDEHGWRGHMDLIYDGIPMDIKALDINTPILTSKGWSIMGDLKDGDFVYAPDGQLTKVSKAHTIRLGRPCYEVKFRDGQSIVADAEHLWEVTTRYGKSLVLTTQDLREKGVKDSDGHNKFAVRVPDALQMPDANLPLDPWLLGMWLGDGTSNDSSITCGEKDLGYLKSRLESLDLEYSVSQDRNCFRVYIKGIRHILSKQLNLLNNKHIPDEYMVASEPQRRRLLAGIMDSDGTVGSHQAIVGMSKESLMKQILQLVRSLGYRATINSHMSRIGDKECGMHWSVRFSSKNLECPFDMPRKSAKYNSLAKNVVENLKRNSIVSVEFVPTRPTRCITVEHESSLYLVGEGFITTHNTMNSAGFARLKVPSDAYQQQLNCYMDYYKAEYGIILVFELGYPFAIKEFRVDRNETMLNDLYFKWEYVRECVALNTPPKQTCCNFSGVTYDRCGAKFICEDDLAQR